LSDHRTIHDILEESYELEQSYTTAPSLSVDPEGFVSSTPAIVADKGKGRTVSTPSQSEVNTLPWGRRDTPPHLLHADEEWAQIDDALNNWSALAEKNKADAIKHRQELTDLQTRVTNSFHRASDVSDAMQGIHKMLDHVHPRYEGQYAPSPSPCALATQALYAKHRSNEGTADYERRQSAQARFRPPQPAEQSRIKGVKSHISLPQLRAPEQRSVALMTLEERFAQSMKESCAHTAKKRLRA